MEEKDFEYDSREGYEKAITEAIQKSREPENADREMQSFYRTVVDSLVDEYVRFCDSNGE